MISNFKSLKTWWKNIFSSDTMTSLRYKRIWGSERGKQFLCEIAFIYAVSFGFRGWIPGVILILGGLFWFGWIIATMEKVYTD